MTREEAIKDLHHLILKLKQADGDDRVYEHYKEAIHALRTEPCEDAIHREREQAYMQGYEDASKNFRREYSEDCISRQVLLSKIETVCFSKGWREFRANNGSNGVRDYIINYIKQMPSVTAEKEVYSTDAFWKMIDEAVDKMEVE